MWKSVAGCVGARVAHALMAAALVVLVPTVSRANCVPGPCTFASSYRLDGGSSIEFKLELGPTENNAFGGGVSQVANAVSQYGVYVSWSTSSGNLRVYVDPELLSQPGVWAVTDHTTYVKISPSALGYSPTIVAKLFQRLGAHEALHIVVGAVETGCRRRVES
jgi:hypothetical protein